MLFIFYKLNTRLLLENFSGLFTGMIVGLLFYVLLKNKFPGIKWKETILIGGIAAFVEDAVLEIFNLDIAYFDVSRFIDLRIFNGFIIAVLALLVYLYFKMPAREE